ncbi:MAG: hypothetical protein ACD_34C00228G0004 [uncultured bacterium]|nr:MAG: hypothetical protein ACD_34C00228G0004 [uncultured bacterium]
MDSQVQLSSSKWILAVSWQWLLRLNMIQMSCNNKITISNMLTMTLLILKMPHCGIALYNRLTRWVPCSNWLRPLLLSNPVYTLLKAHMNVPANILNSPVSLAMTGLIQKDFLLLET